MFFLLFLPSASNLSSSLHGHADSLFISEEKQKQTKNNIKLARVVCNTLPHFQAVFMTSLTQYVSSECFGNFHRSIFKKESEKWSKSPMSAVHSIPWSSYVRVPVLATGPVMLFYFRSPLTSVTNQVYTNRLLNNVFFPLHPLSHSLSFSLSLSLSLSVPLSLVFRFLLRFRSPLTSVTNQAYTNCLLYNVFLPHPPSLFSFFDSSFFSPLNVMRISVDGGRFSPPPPPPPPCACLCVCHRT